MKYILSGAYVRVVAGTGQYVVCWDRDSTASFFRNPVWGIDVAQSWAWLV